MKLILLVQKQIPEKRFQILRCFVNAFLQIRIICTDKCVSEIPRIFLKNIIWYIVAQQLMWLMLITIAMGMCLMNGYSIFKEHGGQKKSPSLSLPLSEGLAHIIPKLFSICAAWSSASLSSESSRLGITFTTRPCLSKTVRSVFRSFSKYRIFRSPCI